MNIFGYECLLNYILYLTSPDSAVGSACVAYSQAHEFDPHSGLFSEDGLPSVAEHHCFTKVKQWHTKIFCRKNYDFLLEMT